MKRSPSIRVRRMDSRRDVPGTISTFVKSLILTVFHSTQTVMLTDTTIKELDRLFIGSTHAELRAAGIYYGEQYLKQKNCDWSPTHIVNCFLFVPITDNTNTDNLTGPLTNQLMARNAAIIGGVGELDNELAYSMDPGSRGVLVGLCHGIHVHISGWVTRSSKYLDGGSYDKISYEDGVLFGYHTGKRFMELISQTTVHPTDILNTNLNDVWVPSLEYIPPQIQTTPPPCADCDSDEPLVTIGRKLDVFNMDTGESVPESVAAFADGLMLGSKIDVHDHKLSITGNLTEVLTDLFQGVKFVNEVYEAGLFYGKYYRSLHPNTNWSLRMLLECQLFNPGHPEYFKQGVLPDFNVYAQELIQRINNWAVGRRNAIQGNMSVYQAQWGCQNSFGWTHHANQGGSWPQQSVWGYNDLDANGYGYIDGLTMAVDPRGTRGVAQSMITNCSAINGLFRNTDRVETWLYGYFTGRRYLELTNADQTQVLDVLKDPLLKVVWETKLSDKPQKTLEAGSLEQIIFQYGLNGGEVPVMRIGELPTNRILALLEAGYNSRVNVIGQEPIPAVQALIDKLKSDKES